MSDGHVSTSAPAAGVLPNEQRIIFHYDIRAAATAAHRRKDDSTYGNTGTAAGVYRTLYLLLGLFDSKRLTQSVYEVPTNRLPGNTTAEKAAWFWDFIAAGTSDRLVEGDDFYVEYAVDGLIDSLNEKVSGAARTLTFRDPSMRKKSEDVDAHDADDAEK